VAHPGLVPVAREVFDEHMKSRNQIRMPAEKQSKIRAEDLVQIPAGTITEGGVRRNISVGLQYLESWLRGNGCVPIFNLMEDAATAEISRTQLWQWIHHGAKLDDGRTVTAELCDAILRETLSEMQATIGATAWANTKFPKAAAILKELSTGPFQDFLTLAAYDELP